MMGGMCYICEKEKLHAFMITPLIQLEDGEIEQCCEKCADENFPGWSEEEEDD